MLTVIQIYSSLFDRFYAPRCLNSFKVQAKNINYNTDFSSYMGPFNDKRMSIINLGIFKSSTAFLFPFITQVICRPHEISTTD